MPKTNEEVKNVETESSTLDTTLRDFQHLKISPKPDEPTCSRKRSHSCTQFTIPETFSSNSTSSSRFRPYALPKISRLIRSKSKVIESDSSDDEDLKRTEPNDDKTSKKDDNNSVKNLQKFQTCSQQANKNLDEDSCSVGSVELNYEIDELAEYFDHFVNVDMDVKMSALAQSMYA